MGEDTDPVVVVVTAVDVTDAVEDKVEAQVAAVGRVVMPARAQIWSAKVMAAVRVEQVGDD